LRERDRAGLRLRVVLHAHGNPWRAGLAVPVAEHLQVAARVAADVGRLHGGDEIVAGYGLAVVAAEVFVEPFPKALAPQQRLLHANDFRTLFIDGGGIEVGDLLIAFGPDRVRHGARVFGELGDAQCRDIVDTLDGPGAGGR